VAARRFVALSAKHLEAWLAADLSRLDLPAVQIEGIPLAEDMLEDVRLVAAVGIDGAGTQHPRARVVGATEDAAVVRALLDDLVKRGLDPSLPRLFLIDRAKALSTAIRRTFGRDPSIRRCQVHKVRNILDRPPKPLHASTRRALRPARERDDAERAETLLCTLARTLRREALGLAGRLCGGSTRS
jgi:transposase-like protein